MLYLVVSSQYLKSAVPGKTPRFITESSENALIEARRILSPGSFEYDEVENVIIYLLEIGQQYTIADSYGTEKSRSKTIVYVGWEHPTSAQIKLVENFYGDFQKFKDTPPMV